MSSTPHPIWGPRTGDYSLASDAKLATLSVESELAGLQAMQTISKLAVGMQSWTPETLGRDIDIHALESALKLALDPATIRQLTNPPVIGGCIRLMKSVTCQRSGLASPFSYKYGYLCFKLLVTVLNVCLLERWNKLEETLARRNEHPQRSVQAITSFGLAGVVSNQILNLYSGGDCDGVLGWFTPASKLRQTSLISQSDTSALFDLLWSDRKLFFRALVEDTLTVCGLSGLFFCLSRYVDRAREFQQNPGGELLKFRLHELSLRYNLVSQEYQREAMALIIGTTSCSKKWNDTPKHVDSEDSRTIMSAYIKQFSGDRDPLAIARDVSIAPSFVPLAADSQTQDLLPEVMRCTIKYGWCAVLDEEEADKLEALVDVICGSLVMLIRPPHNRPYNLSSSTQTNIIKEVYQSDLLDWVACVMTRLGPASNTTLGAIAHFFREFSQVVPYREMEIRFGDYVPNWDRFNMHLFVNTFVVPTRSSTSTQGSYHKCLSIWFQIAKYVGIELAVGEHAQAIQICSNRRCPSARIDSNIYFKCAGCTKAVYCGYRCQRIDWDIGADKTSHREGCTKLT